MRYKYTSGKKQASELAESYLAVVYLRVSSKEQEEGFSIQAQHRLIEEYAFRHSIRIAEVFEDVETAKRSGRKEFKRMLDYLALHPEVQHVLVEKTDRLYRNFEDHVSLNSLSRQVHLIKEGEVLSPDSRSHQKLMHGFKMLMAKNYSDNLSEEVTKGMLEKARGGDFPTKPPAGYLRDRNTKTIMLDPDRAPLIRQAFERYATGNHSLSDIRKWMIEKGYTTRNGKKPPTSSIELMMKNPFYRGEMRWQGKLFKGSHPPLVSSAAFDRVQRMLEGKKPGIYQDRQFAFGQFMTCAHCGCIITAEIKKERYIYYRCSFGRGRCVQKYVNETNLRKQMAGVVEAIRLSPRIIGWIEEALNESADDEREFHVREVARLNDEIARLKARQEQMYLDKLDGLVSEEFWSKKSDEWRRQIQEAEIHLDAHLRADRNHRELAQTTLELAQSAHSLFVQQEPNEQRRLLEHVLSNCLLRDGIVEPEYRKPFALLAYAAKHFDIEKDGSEGDPSKPSIEWR